MKLSKSTRHQVVKIMQWSLLQLCIVTFFASVSFATDVTAQELLNRRITLQTNNEKINTILSEIEKSAEVKFSYNPNLIRTSGRATLNFTNEKLSEVLMKLLSPYHVDYEVVGRQIILKREKRNAKPAEDGHTGQGLIQKEDIDISGKVSDDKGAAIPGVSIIVKGTTKGTITDQDGKYRIAVADNNAVLVFSYVGFLSKEVAILNGSEVNVRLDVDTRNLEELVVVGYGQQKRGHLTGAISTISFDKTMENRPITNASQALSGKVPGVWVSQNSGQPGSDGAQLRIRGWGTLNNANPLVLIDGIEGSISEINPNDIESMSVLKDAASAAIYGSKAANGVVLITTKGGKFDEKTSVNFTSYFGSQKLVKKYDLIENSVEYMNMWNQALTGAGGSKLFPDNVIDGFRNNSDPYKYPNVNFFDEVFRSAPVSEQNLSVKGGSAKSKYYMSVNYLDQKGIMLNTGSKRYGFAANVESKVNKWLTMGGRVNGMRKVSTEPFTFSRVLYIFANGAYPFTAPFTQDGRYGAPQALNNGNSIVGNRNPLIETANGKTRTENNYIRLNAYADIKLADFLSFKTNFTSQNNHNIRERYNQRVFGYTDTGVEAINLDYPTTLEASRSNTDNYNYTWFSTLNFDKTIGTKHTISAIAGMQVENTVIKNTYARRSNPPKAGLIQVDAGTAGIQAQGNMNALRMLSYFGRANYAYADKYLFEMNLRADASSRFKEGNRWGVFPSFSAGWVVTEEDFMKNQNLLSTTKVRASWGRLGNQNINSYWPYLTVVSQLNDQSYNFGGAFAPGAAVTSLVDEGISWETTTSTDIGVELGFLKNRLSLEADYFVKKTSDIIVQLPIPQVLGGVGAPFENVGEMLNKGIELDLSYSNNSKSGDKFGYTIGGNITYLTNKVVKFREGAPDQLYLIREGYSYNTLYGLKAEGVYKTNEEAKAHMFTNGYVPKAGELKYQDVNSDGRIDYQDKMDLGNTIPKFTYGFNTDFSYKGFDLGILFQGIGGVHAYTQNAWTQPLGISGGTITKRWRDAWTPENTDTDIPGIAINNTWNGNASSFWVSNISFLKVRNIQLGYTVPSKLTSRINVQKLHFYVNAQNVFSFVSKNYEGFDPERNTFDSGENFYPLARIVSAGLNLNF
jgi:TonB-linked SusC/RagA family outer membrane protein